MGMVLDVKPCCCGCVHFLPPWDIPAAPGNASRDRLPPIRCAHAPVCALWLTAREAELQPGAEPGTNETE